MEPLERLHLLFTQELPRVLLTANPQEPTLSLMDSAPVPEQVPLHLSLLPLSIANVNSPQTTYISLPPIDVYFLLL